MKFGVIIFPGSNCDHDAFWTVEHVAKQKALFSGTTRMISRTAMPSLSLEGLLSATICGRERLQSSRR